VRSLNVTFPRSDWLFSTTWIFEDEIHMEQDESMASANPVSNLAKYLLKDPNTPDEIRKDQYFLSSPSMACFSLETKEWCKWLFSYKCG
jgi:hypothetical protein